MYVEYTRCFFMDKDLSLGKRIEEQKKKYKMTTLELSEATGVTVGTINKILRGDSRNPQVNSLYKIAKVFDVTVDYLVGGDKCVPTNDEGIQMYLQLDTEDKAEIRGEMRHMLKSPKYKNNLHDKISSHKPFERNISPVTEQTDRELFASHLQTDKTGSYNDKQERELFSSPRPGNVAAYGGGVMNVEDVNKEPQNED